MTTATESRPAAQDQVGGTRVPLSILDLATVSEGSTGADAIRASVDLAVQADGWGYRRVWYAEHHLSPGVASASPAVLAALAASRTSRIRVGSGAVLLSTTSPVIAAEQFGTIAALHPGRVDLGLGRAFVPPPAGATPAAAPAPVPATPARVVDGLHVPATPPFDFRSANLRERFAAHAQALGANRTPGDFRAELELVLRLQASEHVDTAGTSFVSPPVHDAAFDLWVLASSGGDSARVAGALGLPLAANFHVSPSTVLETVASYREAFRPGVLAAPYVVVSVDVLAAATDAEAERLADPHAAWVWSIRKGTGAIAYPRPGTTTPWEERPDDERELLLDRISSRVVGSPATVVERLEALQRATGADELLVTTSTHDKADTVRSFELLAEAWGLASATSASARAATA
ncbi:LLM class flavin-dependent oxidoreductase [Cellulomonas edaphi]|uniref:LLM class flavin-dependent oxidoreductase n=1 Tax=Cellulomonas edaphi TaxID=3053468 RepID=A0ABT7S9G7_9CELL|nr:LLM class flavin-dependent oxidoreductase [Cellulomons edaphi]MDM7831667.1 LLM class flavin-dependent oxidoreductase [Cellulomons edaphi]